LTFIPDDIETHASKILSDVVYTDKVKPSLTAPLVYWLGSKHPLMDRDDVKDLFIVAHNKTIAEYIQISIHMDFDEWFA